MDRMWSQKRDMSYIGRARPKYDIHDIPIALGQKQKGRIWYGRS